MERSVDCWACMEEGQGSAAAARPPHIALLLRPPAALTCITAPFVSSRRPLLLRIDHLHICCHRCSQASRAAALTLPLLLLLLTVAGSGVIVQADGIVSGPCWQIAAACCCLAQALQQLRLHPRLRALRRPRLRLRRLCKAEVGCRRRAESRQWSQSLLLLLLWLLRWLRGSLLAGWLGQRQTAAPARPKS